ncbi:hypothetical protein C0Z19_02255 [Trinickia soli]|uniref:Tox-SHH domain-containing protein n=1 Tax=Trinickia soli TaxID=380675 RepID=A0A2N7WGI8_9BURK|nr:hypothetical protein C0Z19_02255 [Trinickia soli]
MHYNRYRYYDATVGRFISNDPIGLAGGANAYQYAPNPSSWLDPLGRAKRCGCPCGGEPHGNQPSPRPTGYQSHHVIQDRWAKANEIAGYSYGAAPAILIPQNPIHKAISDSQNARRDAAVAAGKDPWSSSIQGPFNYSSQDMRAAGISDETGLHYNRHRYYAASSGRFPSQDPIKGQAGARATPIALYENACMLNGKTVLQFWRFSTPTRRHE